MENNTKKYLTNILKNPVQGNIDAALYLGNIMGLPTNATNYLRDLNVALPRQISAFISAGIKNHFLIRVLIL